MKQSTITIQNGHRNAANGQTGTNGEVDLIDKVFYALSPLLIKAGLQVYYDDAIVKNGANTDYFVALHFDGATNPAYDGGFVDCSPNSITKDKDWAFAQTIADNYFSSMGIRFAPEHRTANSTYYYAFNSTGENTIQTIIECGTLTNPSDKAKCQDYNKIATLLAKGIIQYLTNNDATYQAWLKGQTPPVPVPPPPNYQAQIDSLTTQLAQQKESYTKLQQTTDAQKAELVSKCQSLQVTIDKIKTFVTSA